jgi:hypothetical protein
MDMDADDQSLASYISSLQNSIDQQSINYRNAAGNAANLHRPNNSDVSEDGNSSVQTAINELKAKVESRKAELAEKVALVKDAQSELMRVMKAKEKRAERAKASNEAKLKSIAEENESIVKKQGLLLAKIGDDVKSLGEKLSALQGKHQSLLESKDRTLDMAHSESKKKIARTRKQWEVEEKAIIDKHVESKVAAMKKSIADAMGPSMDRKVEDMRLEIQSLQKSLDTALESKRLQLETEFNEKLVAEVAKFEGELKLGNNRLKARFENEIQELKSRHAEELVAYNTSHMREKQHIEEQITRRRNQEGESAALELKSKKQNFQQMLQELEISCQRDLNLIARKQRDDLEKLESELSNELKEYATKHDQDLKKKNAIALREYEESLRSQIESETHKLIIKVREDALAERQLTRRDLASDLEILRSNFQVRIDDIAAKERRSSERLRALKEEVADLSKAKLSLGESQAQRRQQLNGAKKQVQQLRSELHDVEVELARSEELKSSVLDGGNNMSSDAGVADVSVKIRKLQDNLDKWRVTENDLQTARIDKENKNAQNRELVLRENKDEDVRIRDKIRRVFSAKEAAIQDNRNLLSELQEHSSELLSKLESLRESMLLPSTSAGRSNNNSNIYNGNNNNSSNNYNNNNSAPSDISTVTGASVSNSSGRSGLFSKKSLRK